MAFPPILKNKLSIAILGILAGGLFLGACDDEAQVTPSDLLLLYTGNVHGYIEPCGCVAGQIGGIDRIAGYIKQERSARPLSTLHIDTGDLFAEGVTEDENTVQQLRLKARGFIDVWSAIGCDAIGVGEAEISLGIRELQAMSKDSGIPFLASNIVDKNGERPLTNTLILERGGLRVGLFSLIAPKLEEARIVKLKSDRLKNFHIDEMLEEQGYVLEDWKQRADELIAELRPQVDMLFCVSHLGFNRNAKLAKLHPELDLVFGGHFYDVETPTTMVGDTPVLTTIVKGGRVGRMDWWFTDKEDYLAADNDGIPGHLVDDSERNVLEINRNASRQAYQDLVGLERKYGTEIWNNKRTSEGSLYFESALKLLKLKGSPNVNRFSHTQVPMHSGIPRSKQALEAVDAYHEDTNEYWQSQRAGAMPEPATKGVFVGAQACSECHPSQYEFWLGTRHSRAFATLLATDQQMDAECIGCHTIGYQSEGGFDKPSRADGYEDVQCAACHGGGFAHMSGGPSPMLPGLINKGFNGCVRCHRDEHDPNFAQDGQLKLPKVMCPPMSHPADSTEAMRASYLEAAEALRRRERPNWDRISQAYAGANEPQKALDTARIWKTQSPRDTEAVLNFGERALNMGEFKEASDAFRLITDSDVNNARAWLGLAWALFEIDKAESLIAALEAYSLDPSQVFAARYVGMGLMANGKIEEARKHFKKHVAFNPSHEAILVDLIDQLPPTPPSQE